MLLLRDILSHIVAHLCSNMWFPCTGLSHLFRLESICLYYIGGVKPILYSMIQSFIYNRVDFSLRIIAAHFLKNIHSNEMHLDHDLKHMKIFVRSSFIRVEVHRP